MDLFDMVEHPEVNGLSEDKPFNWDEFVSGKPALTNTGQVSYYGGPCKHPLNTHRFLAVTTVPDHAVIKYGKEVINYLIDERGYWEGRVPFLVKMA